MQVCEYDRYGRPDVIVLRDVPVPVPGRGQVRIRVHAAALNPKDTLTRAGKYRLMAGRHFPKRIGYDWSGEVDALGPGVTRVRLGEPSFGMIQAWAAGACAEFLIAREDELCRKPDGLSWEEAAALPLASLTALQALRDEGQLRPGQRVLINGASGGVGVSAVQIAKALGAHVSTFTSAANMTFVRGLGADETFDYAVRPIAQSAEPYDLIFDAWGNLSFDEVRGALTTHGRYVTTVPSLRTVARRLLGIVAKQRARLVVVASRSADLQVLVDLVERGALHPVIGQTFTLSELAEAQRVLQTKRTRGKLVIRIA